MCASVALHCATLEFKASTRHGVHPLRTVGRSAPVGDRVKEDRTEEEASLGGREEELKQYMSLIHETSSCLCAWSRGSVV